MRRHVAIALGALAAIAALVVALIASGTTGSNRHRSLTTTAQPPSVVLGEPLPAASGELAARINLAQTIIDDRFSPSAELARADLTEQLATLALERQPTAARDATLSGLQTGAGATIRANLQAGAALSGLGRPQRNLPRWRIVQPPPPAMLLGYFEAAQARFGVPWEYLAAIELVETAFGRVSGQSTAGAAGPMQFLPATWARYGSGSISNQRDAILGTARFLRAEGAPANMPGALYRYNDSSDYVQAVEDYADRMRSDVRAYYGYYYWQVVYDHGGQPVILPVGYPKARPQPIALSP